MKLFKTCLGQTVRKEEAMSSRETKEQLVEKIILEKYNNYYRLALSLTHSEADASDAVQEGAYRAIRRSKSLRDPAQAEAWIYRIMLNETYRILKRDINVDLDSVYESDVPSQEDTYEDFDLKKAMDALPPIDKTIVEMRFFEDMKIEEIAEILGRNTATVKSRLYRALKKLRIELNE